MRGNTTPRTEAQLRALNNGILKKQREQQRARREFVQDVEWMASTGETTEGAAERLGVQPQSLAKRLQGAGRMDLWERLRTNEVARFGATLYEIRQLERASQIKGTVRGPRQVA